LLAALCLESARRADHPIVSRCYCSAWTSEARITMDDRLAALVPQPRSAHSRPGELPFSARPVVKAGPGAGTADAAAAADLVLAAVPWPERAGDGADEPYPPQVSVHLDARLAAEAYRLTIGPDGVTIVAAGPAGASYAAQTIRQLLPDDAWRAAAPHVRGSGGGSSPWRLPAAQIEDEPALPWRGAHIDVARHFSTKRELLTLIDALAALKFNRLHLHLTDDQGWRVESRLFPALHEIGSHRTRSRISLNNEQPSVYEDIPHGGYYTLADLTEIAGFAADRMMTLVPEVDLPGHSAALLAAVPELGAGDPPPGGYQVSSDWGILPYLVSPRPKARAAVTGILTEIAEATSASFVHIGGDECVLDRWRTDPKIEAYQRERGLASAEELHAAYLRDIADALAEDLGVRALVWDEGFTSTAGSNGPGLRLDTIVMAWRGMAIARAAAEAGHEVVAVPVFPTYFDYYQERADSEPVGIGGPTRIEDVASFAPVPADWPAEVRSRLIGTQFQSWTEYIRDGRALEFMIFPRACALAEVAWTGGPVAWQETGAAGQLSLRDRVGQHLLRLSAAGVEYRPLSGPAPWQQGGTGPRRHRPGYLVQDVTVYLDELASGA
jgi:hexosaminidase